MNAITPTIPTCMYCGEVLELRHAAVFHPFKPDHGPFDIYECTGCGSAQTSPMPSPESLKALYASYQDGLPDLHRTIMADDPQTSVYRQCVDRIALASGRRASETFTWLDVGAGGGEFCGLMAAAFPLSAGLAVDLHPCPASLSGRSGIEWRQADINHPTFAETLPQADVVASIAVWEHVLRPDLFVSNLLRLVRPRGVLYLLCPDNASLAKRVFRRWWPLFTPGEHLAMPTKRGAVRCVEREWRSLSAGDPIQVQSSSTMLPYTVGYLLRRLGADAIGRMLPTGLSLPMPVGVLELVVRRSTAE